VAAPPPAAPFLGERTVQWTLEEILPLMNKRTLAKTRWRMREGAAAERFFVEILGLLRERGIDRFAAAYGYFPCRRQGKSGLSLRSGGEEFVLDFPRQNKISLADYFRIGDDVAPLFIVTCGESLASLEKELFAADEYSRYLLLHGFGVELAEGLAARMQQRIQLELGLGRKRGKRFSPGFPAWPDLADQAKIVRMLRAGAIGISLTEKHQLVPELSVSAMVVCHPQARYF